MALDLNVHALRQQGDSGYLRAGPDNQTHRFGTNWVSQLVGWKSTSSEENIQLRKDFAQAIRKEYGTDKATLEYIDAFMKLMNGDGTDKTPLSMLEVHAVIDAMDGFQVKQAKERALKPTETTQKEQETQKTTHTENLTLCDKFAPLGSDQTPEKLRHSKEMLMGLMIGSDIEKQVGELNKPPVKQEERIKLLGSDTLIKSMMPEIREELVKLSDGGKHKITDEEAEGVVLQTIARRLQDMSNVISDARREAVQTGLDPHQTVKYVEARLESSSSLRNDPTRHKEVSAHNKDLADGYAHSFRFEGPLTSSQAKQLERTNTIFHDVLDNNRDFTKKLKDINEKLPEGTLKLRLFGSDEFMKSLLPEIRENIRARSDGGRHELSQREVESIVQDTMTKALERMTTAVTGLDLSTPEKAKEAQAKLIEARDSWKTIV